MSTHFRIHLWEKLTLETSKLIMQEGEKLLIELNETAKLLKERALTLMNFALPVFTGLVVYVSQLLQQKEYGITLWVALYFTTIAAMIITLGFKAYWLYKEKPNGIEPREMVKDERKILHVDQEKAFVIARISSIQASIDLNRTEIAKRLNKLERMHTVLKYSIIVAVAGLLVFIGVQHLQCLRP
ncbi:MAG TPA: hypothetical protein VD884_15195 [Ohtaekwangia sp.]|nr:hypothetical protein [Ohtaekwangia sp.]